MTEEEKLRKALEELLSNLGWATRPDNPDGLFLAAQLRLLRRSIWNAYKALKGNPLSEGDVMSRWPSKKDIRVAEMSEVRRARDENDFCDPICDCGERACFCRCEEIRREEGAGEEGEGLPTDPESR